MSIKKNLFFFYFFQFFNGALGILLIPIVARKIGVEGLGILSLLLLVSNFIVGISNWSFYLSGTRDIAVSNTKHRKNIFLTTWYGQCILYLLSILLLVIFILFFKPLYPYRQYIFFVFVFGLSNLFMPLWFTSGLSNFKVPIYFQLLSKVFVFSLLFFYYKNLTLNTYLIIYSASSFFISLVYFFWLFSKYQLIFYSIPVKSIFLHIKSSFSIFSASFLASSFYSLPTLLVSYFLGSYELGLYSALDRIKNIIALLVNPFIQVLLPIFSQFSLDYSVKESWGHLSKYLIFFILVGFFCSFILLFFSSHIISLLFGSKFYEASRLLKFFSFSPLFYIVNNLIIHNMFVARGRYNLFRKLILFATALNFLLISFSIHFFSNILSVICSIMLSEVFLLCLLIRSIHFSLKKA